MEMLPDEKEMTQRLPAKSPLGREWAILIKKRDHEQLLFASAKDKMDYDVSDYRRANMAVLRFIDFWLERVRRAQDILTPRAVFTLSAHQNRVLSHDGVHLSRHTLMRIWQRHTILRYREILKEGDKILKRYHPGLLDDLQTNWKKFRSEIQSWKRQSSPFDGSAACHAMIQFLYTCHLAAARHD